jgi:hypothetical protein
MQLAIVEGVGVVTPDMESITSRPLTQEDVEFLQNRRNPLYGFERQEGHEEFWYVYESSQTYLNGTKPSLILGVNLTELGNDLFNALFDAEEGWEKRMNREEGLDFIVSSRPNQDRVNAVSRKHLGNGGILPFETVRYSGLGCPLGEDGYSIITQGAISFREDPQVPVVATHWSAFYVKGDFSSADVTLGFPSPTPPSRKEFVLFLALYALYCTYERT